MLCFGSAHLPKGKATRRWGVKRADGTAVPSATIERPGPEGLTEGLFTLRRLNDRQPEGPEGLSPARRLNDPHFPQPQSACSLLT